MSKPVNDNDKENVQLENPITMNNDIEHKYLRSRRVEIVADKLVEIYNNSGGRAFYCKVAWRLSEARIWENVEQAANGKNKTGLFIYLCKRDGV